MRDYARKPELQDEESHVEWMKKVPYRALQWEHPTKESEFKKPYLEPDHVRMEAFPQWPFPWTPTWPHPNFPDPVPDDPNSPWFPGEPGEEEEEPGIGCPAACWCVPSNPTTIVAGGDSVVMNVHACPPPNSVSIEIHESNYFKVKTQPFHMKNSPWWAFSILAEANACGLCTIIVSCSDGSGTICYLRCTTTDWTLQCGGCVGNCNKTNGPFYDYQVHNGVLWRKEWWTNGGACPPWCTQTMVECGGAGGPTLVFETENDEQISTYNGYKETCP